MFQKNSPENRSKCQPERRRRHNIIIFHNSTTGAPRCQPVPMRAYRYLVFFFFVHHNTFISGKDEISLPVSRHGRPAGSVRIPGSRRVPENMRPFWFTGDRPTKRARARGTTRVREAPLGGWRGAEKADSEALFGRRRHRTVPPPRARTDTYVPPSQQQQQQHAHVHEHNKGQRKVKRRTHVVAVGMD